MRLLERIWREKFPRYREILFLLKILSLILLIGIHLPAFSQNANQVDTLKKDSSHIVPVTAPYQADSLHKQYDIADLMRAVFHPKAKPARHHKGSGITPMPNISSNPTIGFQVGIKAVAGRVLGHEPNTLMSVASTSASITTKGIIYIYLSHNIFTPGNKWNLQGSLVAAKTVTPDFGLGIGHNVQGTEADKILANPARKGYVLHAQYYSFREKIYKQVMENLFLGAGVSFEIRRKIEDKKNLGDLTPYNIYSDRYGFPRDHYFSNGLLFNVEYTTRDNQNNAYKGIYADVGVRFNQTWIGSTKNAALLTTDFRKYFNLSGGRPGHVIALWNWGSYLISGALPYLEIPGTGKDPGSRSGRGYTVTYFKGTKYNYSEIEYRFPILRNRFLSGVTFFNLQTANDLTGTKLFQYWQPGGGAGLRILFNKATRTNLCLDYGWGKFGSKGLFLNLNEVF